MGGSMGNIIRAAVGVGTLGLSEAMFYQPMRQQEKAREQAAAAQRAAEMEARRIAAEKKPMEESAKLALSAQSAGGGGIMDLMINPDRQKKTTSGIGTGGGTTGIGV